MWARSPESGRSPEGGNGNPPQYSCLENPQTRPRSLADYNPWGHKESDTIEQQSTPTPTSSKGIMSCLHQPLLGGLPLKVFSGQFPVPSPHPGPHLPLTLLSFTISTYLSRFYPPDVLFVANSQSKMWSHNLLFALHFFIEVQMFSLVQTPMMQQIFILRKKNKQMKKKGNMPRYP